MVHRPRHFGLSSALSASVLDLCAVSDLNLSSQTVLFANDTKMTKNNDRTQIKNPNHLSMRWFGFFDPLEMFELTYKHLILAVSLINGLRHWRNEDFEAAAKARHNRSEFARRLYNLRMYEVCGHCYLPMRAVDCPAHEFHFVLASTAVSLTKTFSSPLHL